MNFMQYCIKFCDKYTSANDVDTSINNINTERIVCLVMASCIFSFLLSCIIDLYTCIPLTANVIIQGIIIMFLRNIVVANRIMLFLVPSTYISDDEVNPIQNPLKHTIT